MPNLWPDGPDAVVEQRALVVVEIRWIRIPTVEAPRELQHVVGAAALSGVHAEL